MLTYNRSSVVDDISKIELFLFGEMTVLVLAFLLCTITRADKLVFSPPNAEVGFTPMSDDDQVAMETRFRVPQLSDKTSYYESDASRKGNLQVSESRLNHQLEKVRLPRNIVIY